MTVRWWRHAQSLTERPMKGMLTGAGGELGKVRANGLGSPDAPQAVDVGAEAPLGDRVAEPHSSTLRSWILPRFDLLVRAELRDVAAPISKQGDHDRRTLRAVRARTEPKSI
jgi:hypothetical protein